MNTQPDKLGIIAGRGAYPLLLAQSAKREGVGTVFAVGFKGETDPKLAQYVDALEWVHLGLLDKLLNIIGRSGVGQFVMAGQIRPTHLFHLRMDKRMLALLGRLRQRNAETIFGALGAELKSVGVELLPASLFMESCMPDAGLLSVRAPTPREARDIELGLKLAKTVSSLDIGQTVIVKEGTVLAVEAFEGTNDAIRRAAKLGGAGAVVVKVAKPGHDMRFDIPVVGVHTLKVLRKARVSALAVEARRTIVLEREKVVAAADKAGLALIAVAGE
ncbi:MAG: UDP-2,3-diacylglucosamine diphosphatase LpxI [Kiritimatiellae bacterium]|nr:UDP-2,3-diacylglucosamine diphosphatase LpxI [Kiritimatiellia bacterium]